MEDLQERQITITDGGRSQQLTAKSVAGATAAGLVVGGPLLGLMGFSFVATVILFLVASPLLLIFSPLLIGVAVVLTGALVGFGLAAVMAVVGVSSLVWIVRQLGLDGGVMERMVESAGVRVKEIGQDWGGYFEDKAEERVDNG